MQRLNSFARVGHALHCLLCFVEMWFLLPSWKFNLGWHFPACCLGMLVVVSVKLSIHFFFHEPQYLKYPWSCLAVSAGTRALLTGFAHARHEGSWSQFLTFVSELLVAFVSLWLCGVPWIAVLLVRRLSLVGSNNVLFYHNFLGGCLYVLTFMDIASWIVFSTIFDVVLWHGLGGVGRSWASFLASRTFKAHREYLDNL